MAPGNDGPQWILGDADAGVRLDKFLAAGDRLGSRGRAVSALERGKVYVNDAEVGIEAAGTRLDPGDTVRVWVDRPGSAKRPRRAGRFGDLDIVYEDDVLLVVNKPAGILAVPLERRRDDVSVVDQLMEHYRSHRKWRPFVVHRIDRDTSGLVVFAKNARAQRQLKEQFKRHDPERIYWAVVYGHPDPPAGAWRDRLTWDERFLIQKETHPTDPKGRDAVSEYRVLESFAATSLIEVRLWTGRRNQIRIQARLRGHTLVGEKRYVYGPDELRGVTFGRQALHALRLEFLHPVDGRRVALEAPPPADFTQLLATLRRG